MQFHNYPVIALDTETTGLDVFRDDKVFGFSVSYGNEDFYFDIRREPGALEELRRQLADYKGVVVGHNLKFDAHALYASGIDLTPLDLDDTMIREQLLDEHQYNYDLDTVAKRRLGLGKEDIISELAKIFGGRATKNVQMKNLHKAPVELVAKYAKRDTRAALDLYMWQETQDIPEIHSLEKRVLKVLIKMERLGVRVDEEAHMLAIEKVRKAIAREQAALERMAGREVNVNSPKQMMELFAPVEKGRYFSVGGVIIPATKGGAPQFNADSLKEIGTPLAKQVLKVRKYRKIHDTFLTKQLADNIVDGRVHPWYNQTSVVTGRLSCTRPNMQAVPKRDPEMKAILRTLIIPEEGHELLRCDYEQSDIRGFAHYLSQIVDDHPVLNAYREDPLTDFHQYVADLLGIERNPNVDGPNAKQMNLACIFNMGPGKLAKQMGLPYEEFEWKGKTCYKPGPEAKRVFDLYHSKIPGAAEMGRLAEKTALHRGYVRSICGRHLRFPGGDFAYRASGYLYQSFTADLIKQAMVAVAEETGKIHLQIHDELVMSIADRDEIPAIKYAMEHALDGFTEIPIRTCPEVGPNWADTRSI